MSIELWLAFVAASAVLLIIPGPTIMATLNAALYAVFARATSRLLASQLAQRSFNLAGGSLLCAAGVWALLARRQG